MNTFQKPVLYALYSGTNYRTLDEKIKITKRITTTIWLPITLKITKG
jgi:hypothetical protein